MQHKVGHIVTIVVCLLLIASMFAYIGWMQACVSRWKGANVELPSVVLTAISVAMLLRDYWFVPVAVLGTIAAISAALLWQRRDDA